MRTTQASMCRVVLAAVAAAAACSDGAPAGRPARSGGAEAAVPVIVAEAVQKPMPVEIRAIGTAEAHATVAVRSQITGELTAVHFREGEDVRVGQVLFSLDRRPFEATLREAQSRLDRDTALAANASAQASRYADLARRGIAPQEQAEQFTTQAAALEATIAADRAAVEHARVQLEYSTIHSRISGRAGALMVHAGNLVRGNDETPLVVINELAPIHVSFPIPEAHLADLRRYFGAGSIRVTAQSPEDVGSPAMGRITFIDNAVDQTTGTIRLKATFANEAHQLWPGQFVHVTVILTTDPRAVVVPTMAIQAGPEGDQVFVVTENQTVELRPVKVSRTLGSETAIDQGLTAGETVITDGHIRLLPGSRISIKSERGQGVTP